MHVTLRTPTSLVNIDILTMQWVPSTPNANEGSVCRKPADSTLIQQVTSLDDK